LTSSCITLLHLLKCQYGALAIFFVTFVWNSFITPGSDIPNFQSSNLFYSDTLYRHICVFQLKYLDAGKEMECLRQVGKWNMVNNSGRGIQFLSPLYLAPWTESLCLHSWTDVSFLWFWISFFFLLLLKQSAGLAIRS
jgi:hypothetical protein